MKKSLTILSLAAVALLALPTLTRAEDTNAAPATTESGKPAKKGTQFHGTVAAVDTTASTITVDETKDQQVKLTITSNTKIVNHGAPATLADIKTGEKVGGFYKKEGEKNVAIRINLGAKGPKKKAE
jgi:Cu/Ag efflux protein CusF